MSAPPIVALDIGTSTIRVAVGESLQDGSVRVTGYREEPSCGIRKGEVIDIDNAVKSVKAALQGAEESADVSIRSVYMLITGGHIASMVNRGIITIMGPSGEVGESDIEEVGRAARKIKLDEGRAAIHTVNQHFNIDDQGGIMNPLEMEGRQLGLKVLIVHGAANRMRNMAKVAESVPVSIEDSAYSALCSGLSVLSPEQKESGVLLIDLGGGTTDILLYAPGYMALAESIGVGGEHVTNDIAIGLKMPHSQAAGLKIARGSALVNHSLRGQSVSLPASVGFSGRTVKLANLNMIINARMEEIFSMVKQICDAEGLLKQIGGGVVLTGGGANMREVAALAEKAFNMPATVGHPRNVSGIDIAAGNPEHAAVTGLLRYAANTERLSQPGGLTTRIINMFRRS